MGINYDYNYNRKARAAAEYLEQIGEIDEHIRSLKNTEANLMEMCDGVKSPVLDPIGGGRSSDISQKTEDMAIKLINAREEIAEAVQKLVDMKINAIRIIQQIPKIKYRNLLMARYVELKTVEKYAEERDESDRGIYKRSNQALECFYDVWKNTLI